MDIRRSSHPGSWMAGVRAPRTRSRSRVMASPAMLPASAASAFDGSAAFPVFALRRTPWPSQCGRACNQPNCDGDHGGGRGLSPSLTAAPATRPPPPKETTLSFRADLKTWKRIAVLLAAAAILLAAPYGIAVAVRSGIASIILWKSEIAISAAAVDASAPASLLVPPATCRFNPAGLGHPRSAAVSRYKKCRNKNAVYCAASFSIACSFAAVSSLSDAGCGMAITL